MAGEEHALSPKRPGEIYVDFKTCKRPVSRLTAPEQSIDGWSGVGVPYLSAAARQIAARGSMRVGALSGTK